MGLGSIGELDGRIRTINQGYYEEILCAVMRDYECWHGI